MKSNGTFTKEAQKIAKDKAMAKCMELFNEDMKSILSDVYGNLDTFLDVMIESAVLKQKQ